MKYRKLAMHLYAPFPTTSMKFSQVTCTLLLFISIYLLKKKNLATSHGIWDLSSPTRDQTHAPYVGPPVLTTGLPGKSQLLISHLPTLVDSHSCDICPVHNTACYWLCREQDEPENYPGFKDFTI